MKAARVITYFLMLMLNDGFFWETFWQDFRDQPETGILIGWHRQFIPKMIQADAQENNLLLMLEGEALKSREDRGV